MSDLKQISLKEADVAPRRRYRVLQWNVASLLLLMAAVSVWTSYFTIKSESKRMDMEVNSLIRIARELTVHDPSQFAIVERQEQWHGEHAWDVHVPDGNQYLLKLATRDIQPKIWVKGVVKNNFPETDHAVKLAPGQHVISLEKTLSGEEPQARLLVDGQVVFEVIESEQWAPKGSYSYGGGYDQSTQAPTDEPLELIRIRFRATPANGTPGFPNTPQNGIAVWIEQE